MSGSESTPEQSDQDAETTDSVPEPESEPVPGPESEPESEPETEAVPESVTEPVSRDIDTDTDTETEAAEPESADASTEPSAEPAESAETSESVETSESAEPAEATEAAESVEPVEPAEAAEPADSAVSPEAGDATTEPAEAADATETERVEVWASPDAAAAPEQAAAAPADQGAVTQVAQAVPAGQSVPPSATPPEAAAQSRPGYAFDAGNYLGGLSPAVPAKPPVDKRKRKRVLWTVAAVVAAAALVTGGVIALLPGRTGNSVVATVECAPTKLASCLIKAPEGAVRLTASSSTDPWPQQTVSSMDQYGSNIVDYSPGIDGDATSELAADHAGTVVHNDWNAVDGDDVDMVLLSFPTQKDAKAWNAVRDGEILAAYPGQSVAIAGDSTGAAHVATKQDAHGNIDAGYSVVVGDLVLDVSYSSPSPFDAQDLKTWAGTELASLHTAPPAAVDPADAAPSTEQVACTGSELTSCLMSVPDGGEAWTNPTSSSWQSGSNLSSSQLVHEWWRDASSSSQSAVLADFTADGVTGIAHEDWTLDDGDEQADVYLIQAITATGADELDSEDLGEPDWDSGGSGDEFNVPDENGALAWHSSKTDKQGFDDAYVTDSVGNVDVVEWIYNYGSFDSHMTDGWAQSQINRVSAAEKTVPMGLFSLTAPSLPAPAQASCGASADCVMPLPGGASDTTSSSYQVTADLSAASYASQYESLSNQEFTDWLGADGFVSAAHRSWTASDGATADAVVLKYAKPAQAQAAASLEYGINAVADRVCTDSALPDSYCLAAPVSPSDYLQKEQVWVLAWKGDYQVDVQVTVSNSADVSQAYAWAEQQLDMLPAN